MCQMAFEKADMPTPLFLTTLLSDRTVHSLRSLYVKKTTKVGFVVYLVSFLTPGNICHCSGVMALWGISMSCQELGMGPYELSSTHAAILTGSILCRSCAGHRNCCEFMGTVVLRALLRLGAQLLTAAVLMLLLHVLLWAKVRYRCPIDDWTHCWHSRILMSRKSPVLTVIHWTNVVFCCGLRAVIICKYKDIFRRQCGSMFI